MRIKGQYKGVPICVVDVAPDVDYLPGTAEAINYTKEKYAFNGSCTILLLRQIVDSYLYCFHADLIKALHFCVEKGIKVITFSMRSFRDFTEDEIKLIKDNNIIIVVAAGNEGEHGISPTNANPNVITVAAYDKRGYIEGYSSRGEAVDVTAVTDWDVELRHQTTAYTGTSGATPVISACIAAYLYENPGKTFDEVYKWIKQNSLDMGTVGQDVCYGWGLFQMPEVLKEEKKVKFTDVPDYFWAKNEIDNCAEVGLVEGYEDGTFKPNEPITRAEVCAIICRLLQIIDEGYEIEYEEAQ